MPSHVQKVLLSRAAANNAKTNKTSLEKTKKVKSVQKTKARKVQYLAIARAAIECKDYTRENIRRMTVQTPKTNEIMTQLLNRRLAKRS